MQERMADTKASTVEAFVLGVYLKPTLVAFLKKGGRLSALANAIGKADLWLYNPPEKVDVRDYLAFMQAASELCHDPYIGLLSGQLADLSSFDLLGDALGLSNTLADALQQVMALERLVHRLGDSSVQAEGSDIRLIWRSRYQNHPAIRLVSENVLAGIVQLAQTLTGRSLPIREMTFMNTKPEHYIEKQYQALCQGICRFSQPYNSLLIARDVLDWPLKKMPMGGQDRVNSTVTLSLADQLTELLEQRLAHNPSLSQASAIFGCSQRVLQRKLKQESQSFQQVLTRVRLRKACDYLKYSTMSLMQISQRLGFREQSSFNHFFVGQMGQSPRAYRQQTKAESQSVMPAE